ncbi:MAG: redoxin domain-containing protein [Saprospiraceae bacterium]
MMEKKGLHGSFYNLIKFLIVSIIVCFLSCQKQKCPNLGDQFADFSPIEWLQAPAQSIYKLKGNIILIRWWTDECIYCVNSSDALNIWYDKYHSKGLEILGIYHPKPRGRKPNMEEIREYVQEKGFHFPIGLDLDWVNLDKYWNACGEKEFTSVSFLIDKAGRLVFVHEGGEYHQDYHEGHEDCVKDFYILDSTIQKLLEDRNTRIQR